MKNLKNLKGLILTVFFFLMLINSVSAQSNLGIPSIPNPSIFNNLEDIVNFAAQLIRPVFILTFIGMILYAAGVILTAGADDTKIANGRKIIIAAIVGLSIAVFAPAITGIIASFIGVDTLDIFNTSTP